MHLFTWKLWKPKDRFQFCITRTRILFWQRHSGLHRTCRAVWHGGYSWDNDHDDDKLLNDDDDYENYSINFATNSCRRDFTQFGRCSWHCCELVIFFGIQFLALSQCSMTLTQWRFYSALPCDLTADLLTELWTECHRGLKNWYPHNI